MLLVNGKDTMGRLHDELVANYDRYWRRCRGAMGVSQRRCGTWRSWDRSFSFLLDPRPKTARFLDLGCGTGAFFEWLATRRGAENCQGVDVSAGQIEGARRAHPGLDLHCADGLAFLREHPVRFEGIFCHHVLEHLAEDGDLQAWLQAARAALVPGGFFCCSSHNAANLAATFTRYRDPTHRRLFTVESLRFLLETTGYRDCREIDVVEVRPLRALRNVVQWSVHKLFYLLCGHGDERVFTPHVTLVGFAAPEGS